MAHIESAYRELSLLLIRMISTRRRRFFFLFIFIYSFQFWWWLLRITSQIGNCCWLSHNTERYVYVVYGSLSIVSTHRNGTHTSPKQPSNRNESRASNSCTSAIKRTIPERIACASCSQIAHVFYILIDSKSISTYQKKSKTHCLICAGFPWIKPLLHTQPQHGLPCQTHTDSNASAEPNYFHCIFRDLLNRSLKFSILDFSISFFIRFFIFVSSI